MDDLHVFLACVAALVGIIWVIIGAIMHGSGPSDDEDVER